MCYIVSQIILGYTASMKKKKFTLCPTKQVKTCLSFSLNEVIVFSTNNNNGYNWQVSNHKSN